MPHSRAVLKVGQNESIIAVQIRLRNLTMTFNVIILECNKRNGKLILTAEKQKQEQIEEKWNIIWHYYIPLLFHLLLFPLFCFCFPAVRIMSADQKDRGSKVRMSWPYGRPYVITAKNSLHTDSPKINQESSEKKRISILSPTKMDRCQVYENFLYAAVLGAACCVLVPVKLNESNTNGHCLLFGELDILTNTVATGNKSYCFFAFYSSLGNAILAALLGFLKSCCIVNTERLR